MPLRSVGLVAALLLAGHAQAAHGYQGRVHGSIAGHAIDVPVICERHTGFLKPISFAIETPGLLS